MGSCLDQAGTSRCWLLLLHQLLLLLPLHSLLLHQLLLLALFIGDVTQ